jgi:hypothetical protein
VNESSPPFSFHGPHAAEAIAKVQALAKLNS